MNIVNCGDGPFVLLESVICPACGPRLWTTFDDDPNQIRIVFPAIVRSSFVRDWGPCVCGQQVLSATRPIDDSWAYFDNGERIGLTDGSEIPVYELVSALT